MERFKRGMACCKVDRESVGLGCSYEQQLACGKGRLAGCFARTPEHAGRLLSGLISTFPDRLAAMHEEAVRAGRVRLFIERAAPICAALPTKSERHAFRDQIAGQMCAADLSDFDDQMSAEWRRLRGK
ncbi:hypothetical protein WJ32_11000 [Burkholderia ubonensis]|uniref:Uncharacterized protein n=1 Tax=Burkholderia ubonensis TaxID=101571 RepID=A0A118HUV9_9BURK|nr:hypothetical protein [Burkholderia ubonensis]AOJ62941.1 hypothetical protein WJ32_11000 [Burkholderia ubonensis]KVG70085.1 hypothetical protein WJ33_21680 [Burkholderia ubonensis]